MKLFNDPILQVQWSDYMFTKRNETVEFECWNLMIGEKLKLVTLALIHFLQQRVRKCGFIDSLYTDWHCFYSGYKQWNNSWLNIYWCLRSLLVVYGEHLQIFDKASARPIKLVELNLIVKS